jgi:hypothetical protein
MELLRQVPSIAAQVAEIHRLLTAGPMAASSNPRLSR